MGCDRCKGTGLDPHAYIVQRGTDGTLQAQVAAPCPECQPDHESAGPLRPDEEPTP